MKSVTRQNTYGLLAEFKEPEALKKAASAIHDEGYRRIDAFSPFPVDGLANAVGFRRSRLTWFIFCGGVFGAVGGLYLQYYLNAVDFPINVGGRPLASWPAFGVIAFELCILSSAIFALIGLLWRNRLPTPYHPVFNVDEFSRASTDRFFLLVESEDQLFDLKHSKKRLISLGADEVYEVPH